MKLLEVLLFGLALAGSATGSSGEKPEGTPYFVQIRESVGYEKPGSIYRVVFRLPYTHPVRHLASEGAWWRVQPEGDYQEGWLHSQELSPEPFVLEGIDKKTRKRIRKEESLVGRAFRPKVELVLRERKSQSRYLRGYEWLDQHLDDELFHPEIDELLEFIDAGGLAPLEGGGS